MKLPLHALITLSLLVACGEAEVSDIEPADTDPTSAIAALESSYGGITSTDEAPRFDDQDVRNEDELDDDVPLIGPPDRERPAVGAVILSLRYGDLANDRPSTSTAAPGHWRFRIGVDGGTFVRGRVYADRDEDPGLTRIEPNVVVWTSTTPPGDHDGAKFAVVLGPNAEGIAFSASGTTFALPTRTLAHHESFHRTDAGLLYVRTYRVTGDGPNLCAGGTLRGRVSGLGADGVGRVAAVVRDHEGDTIGHLRGRYGVRDDGSQVFFAKLIGRNGAFMARARGVFERLDDNTVAIAARLHAADGRAIGVVQGRIVDSNEDRPGATLLARWAYACDDTMPQDRLPPESDQAERDR